MPETSKFKKIALMKTSNLVKYQSKNPIQQALIARFQKKVISLVKQKNLETIADIGCGEGFGLKNLSINNIGTNYLGLDSSKTSLKLARNINPEFEYVLGSIYKTQLKNKSFDMVMCTEVLEHLEDPEAAIVELRRISKKYVLISVPFEPWFRIMNFLRGKYLNTLGNHPEHINWWGKKGLMKLVSKHLKIRHHTISLPWQIVLCEV